MPCWDRLTPHVGPLRRGAPPRLAQAPPICFFRLSYLSPAPASDPWLAPRPLVWQACPCRNVLSYHTNIKHYEYTSSLRKRLRFSTRRTPGAQSARGSKRRQTAAWIEFGACAVPLSVDESARQSHAIYTNIGLVIPDRVFKKARGPRKFLRLTSYLLSQSI